MEIIQTTGGPQLWLHWKPDSKVGWRKIKYSDVININISTNFNHLPLVRFLPAQNDMVVCHS
jgi:hypothetical protein